MRLKHLFLNIVIFALVSIFGCDNRQPKVDESINIDNDKDKYASIEFDKKYHNFGRLNEGEIVSFTFFYKNSGNAGLVINNVKTSCGCTTSGWKKEPVKPGEKGKLEVSFDSSGKSGIQLNEITVYSNAPEHRTLKLTIKAEII